MKKIILLAIITSLFHSCKQQVKEEAAPLIDMKAFFKNGEKSSFRISPDGNYFSYRADHNGIANIFVQKVSDSTVVQVSHDTLRSLYSYFWKGDRIVYEQDMAGDENFQLFSVKADGSDLKALTPFAGIRSDIVDDLRDIEGKENVLLVQINKRVREYFDPYLLNIETGELKLLYDNKENFDYWFTDNNGVIRLASKTDGVNITWHYRSTENEPFTPLLSTTFKEHFYPAAFDKDNKNFYATSNVGRDKITAVEYDPTAKKEIIEWYGNENYDIRSVNYDRKKQKITSVLWDAEKPKNHFFDKEWGDIQKSLEKKFDGYEVDIVSYTDDRSKAIVWIGSDKMPGKYYIYDFNTKET
jgi:hypothetical protein